MSEVRFGVVGFGNIGRTHVQTLVSGAVGRARATAVVSRQPAELPEGVLGFQSAEAMLESGEVDAVIVATPTMNHPAVGKQVLDAGLHLVMEKPVAMSLAEAQALVEAVPDGALAAVMLNQRHHPVYRQIHDIIAQGRLGRLVRYNWLMTAWYRPEAYFQVSTWRGTWPGEGGGALLNQCIHNLDVLQWILGMPESLVADARFGKFHQIDVEDEVTAMLSGAHGVTGVVVMSTGEAPGANRLDIVGDRGTLSYDGDTLHLATTEGSISEHCASTRDMFGVPSFEEEIVQPLEVGNQHACVLQDFVDAVLDGKPLSTPLEEGLGSVELANAMLMSAWLDRRVHLPLDAFAYQVKLEERIEKYGLRQAQDIDVHVDMEASYR